MNFKEWLEATGMVNSPWMAMDILHLTQKAGQTLTQPELMDAYRSAAREAHPDSGGSHDAMKLVNAAKDFLGTYVNNTLPSRPAAAQRSFWPEEDPKPKRTTTKERPRGSQTYSVKDLENFIQEIMQMGAIDAYVKTKIERVPFHAALDGVCNMPLGSREKKLSAKDWDANQMLNFIYQRMMADRAEYPEGIVCIKSLPNAQQPYGWITYYWDANRDWERMLGAHVDDFYLRTIEFIKPEVKVKVKDALKNRANAEAMLREKGMRRLSTTKDTYWGLEEHMQGRTPIGYLIETSPRMFSLVHRYRYDYGYKKEMKVITLDSKPYGQLTPQMIDVGVAWVKKKFETKGFGEKE